jgi:hypothetical protein
MLNGYIAKKQKDHMDELLRKMERERTARKEMKEQKQRMMIHSSVELPVLAPAAFRKEMAENNTAIATTIE